MNTMMWQPSKLLRVLIHKVDCAGALAFFLLGIVSHLPIVLIGAKTLISGVAASMEARDLAIRGLVESLMIIIQDDANTYPSTLSLLEELFADAHLVAVTMVGQAAQDFKQYIGLRKHQFKWHGFSSLMSPHLKERLTCHSAT